MALRLAVSFAAFIGFAGAFGTGASASSLTWWTVHALQKVRPGDPAPARPKHEVHIEAARNEFEPFQVVLLSPAADIPSVDVEASELRGPGSAVIPVSATAVYLQRYITLTRASSVEGGPGDWPDALIPRTDSYAGERRNAFPFVLRRGRTQALWIEVYIPSTAVAGKYSGNLKITAEGRPETEVPINLTVWNFTLPSTSSLRSAFGFSGVNALNKHRGRYTTDDDLLQITRLYAKAALRHRISTYGGSMLPPPFSRSGGRITIDWRMYEREQAPFLDGTIFGPGDPLPGASVTAVDLRTHGDAHSEEDQVLYWRAWVRHFRERGWSDRLYHYLWDEPSSKDMPQVAARGKLSRRADPQLQNLVTAALDRRLVDVIDIWAPLINCFDSKPGFPAFCAHQVPRPAYDRELRGGRSLWWYQSCASHGCNGVTSEYFRGWPSYTIDSSAMSNRVMQWLSWSYRIEGNLYFSMNESYSLAQDPWQNVYLHGGNGDGSLFYPGRPDNVGGSSDLPVESLRLKLIREGFEDYEYLATLAATGRRTSANEYAARVAPRSYRWTADPEVLYSVRRAIGETLNREVQP
jgi:hypothetical protein